MSFPRNTYLGADLLTHAVVLQPSKPSSKGLTFVWAWSMISSLINLNMVPSRNMFLQTQYPVSVAHLSKFCLPQEEKLRTMAP